mgnify:CR=1 FL=1
MTGEPTSISFTIKKFSRFETITEFYHPAGPVEYKNICDAEIDIAPGRQFTISVKRELRTV